MSKAKKGNNLQEEIMAEIRQGRVKIRSRLSFWAARLGLGSEVFLVFLLFIFLLAGLLFWINLNEDLFLESGYGRYRLRLFFYNLPYLLVMLFIVVFVLLSKLIKKYDFSYKKPFLVILSVILALGLVFSWAMLRYPQTSFWLARTPIIFGQRIIQGKN